MKHNFQEKINFIWSIADLLRGDYKQAEFQDVILPFTVLKRLDDVLEPKKEKVLKKDKELKERGIENKDLILQKASGYPFYNTSKFTFQNLLQDPNNIAKNLRAYINGFSQNMYNILENFEFGNEIKKLDGANLLYLIIQRFNEIDLHPDAVSNHEMGTVFEELIRRFSEQSNETAGEHFTPREVIRLMVRLLIAGNGDLRQKNIIRTIYDPACGTGGMLTIAKDEILGHINPTAQVYLFGQELNPKTFAIAKSDVLIKGEEADNVKKGNSFSEDQLHGRTFDIMLSNPPFGVEWRKVESPVREEADNLGNEGRFGAGLPRISDGSLLFLQHMISKMKPKSEGGSRIAIVFNGSPLFTGDAGSGESEIRRWIIENDWLETIVGLPDQLFYNTGIYTYFWIVTNNKSKKRKRAVQLIDAREYYENMRKSLGNKRHYVTEKQIDEIVNIYKSFTESDKSKIFSNDDLGYHKITVERPLQLNFQASDERIDLLKEEKPFQNLVAAGFSLRKRNRAEQSKEIEKGKEKQEKILKALKSIGKGERPFAPKYKNRDKFEIVLDNTFKEYKLEVDKSLKKAILKALSEHDETADIIYDKKGNPEPDPDLRDYENVPLKDDIHEYFEREVKPHVTGAWIDEKKTKVGYEISFTKYFYKYKPLRSIGEITKDIKKVEEENENLLEEILKV
ncbi:MAG: DNA methylase [Candidatus Scalindua rubra]|uniref:site-specific DNA-methyltransferase (adenine-specific) n=1 Tax=Candidatus Scalindua rubra TaxID=1872076 RepID=A0A1E3X6U9_9BACT|nr:MAG: DNA methylase [Candidatus Scalindua rubra]